VKAAGPTTPTHKRDRVCSRCEWRSLWPCVADRPGQMRVEVGGVRRGEERREGVFFFGAPWKKKGDGDVCVRAWLGPTHMSKSASSLRYSTRTIMPQRRARVPYSTASKASSGPSVCTTTVMAPMTIALRKSEVGRGEKCVSVNATLVAKTDKPSSSSSSAVREREARSAQCKRVRAAVGGLLAAKAQRGACANDNQHTREGKGGKEDTTREGLAHSPSCSPNGAKVPSLLDNEQPCNDEHGHLGRVLDGEHGGGGGEGEGGGCGVDCSTSGCEGIYVFSPVSHRLKFAFRLRAFAKNLKKRRREAFSEKKRSLPKKSTTHTETNNPNHNTHHTRALV
jgi:hypothetical protein